VTAQLDLLTAPRAAPPGPPPWSPARYEPPYVTPPLARASDPATSHRAAEAAFPDARAQNAMIVAAVNALGTRGGTAAEIAEALGPGWDSVIVSRRIAGLRLNHLVSLDGREGRPLETRSGPSGRLMTVHYARRYAPRKVA